MKYPTISSIPSVQSLYVQVRKNLKADAKRDGTESNDQADHRFAEMLALKSPPRSMTDREFFAGVGTLDQQFKTDPQHLDKITKISTSQGYRPNPNDVYVPTLARHPGDPAAFISPSGGRGQLKATADRLGLAGNGAVKTTGRKPEKDPLKNATLAPDVMNQLMAHETRKARREGKKVSRGELREKVLANHVYKM